MDCSSFQVFVSFVSHQMNSTIKIVLISCAVIVGSLICFRLVSLDTSFYEFFISPPKDSVIIRIQEEVKPKLDIREGFVSTGEQFIPIIRGDDTLATVYLGEPRIVAQADKPEEWGYFQFPKIFRNDRGDIVVSWQMNTDSHLSYGVGSSGLLISKDEGETWVRPDYSFFNKSRYSVELSNGDILQVKTSKSICVRSFQHFPLPVNKDTIFGHTFYQEKDLPYELRGVYLERKNPNGVVTEIHGLLKDEELLRYAIDDMMPIIWWGDILETEDSILVACVYGGFYRSLEGNVLRTSISFYKSFDFGYNWTLISTISEQGDDGCNVIYDGQEGFGEPAFEIVSTQLLLWCYKI